MTACLANTLLPVPKAHSPAGVHYPLALRLECRFNSAINLAAVGGAVTFPSTISLFDIGLPYMSLFASSSGRIVAPSSEMPANSPRDREYVRISA